MSYTQYTDDELLKMYKKSKEETELNDLVQMAVKELANGGYGALANKHFLFFDTRIAEGITMTGQVAIQRTQKKLNEYINKVLGTDGNDYIIAGDTDSVLFSVNGIVQKFYADKPLDELIGIVDTICKKRIEPYIDQVCADLTNELHGVVGKLSFKREAIAECFLGTSSVVVKSEEHGNMLVTVKDLYDSGNVHPEKRIKDGQQITYDFSYPYNTFIDTPDGFKEVYTILKTDKTDQLHTIHTDKGNLEVTASHMVPIKTDGVKAFSCAMDIMIGDVLCFNNTEAKVVNISVRVLNDSYYDISLVEKDYNKQTFFLDGFEVHNCGFWTGKKRYGMKVWDNEGVRYKEPEYKIVGLDLVKTSIPADVRKHMKESVLMILNRGTKDSVVKYNNDYKTEFMKLPVEAISFPRGVNGIGKYSNSTTIYEKATPMQSRAALLYNHLVKKLKLESKYPMIKEGDKIKYCYLRMPNPLKENVIGFIDVLPPEFNLTKWADYTTMYDKGFMSQMNTIMDAIGWSTSTKGTLDW